MSGENVFLQLSLYFGLLELLSSHYRAGGEQMQHQINASSTQVSINVFFFLESHTSLLRDRWLGVFVLFVLEKNPCVGNQFVMNFLNLLFI